MADAINAPTAPTAQPTTAPTGAIEKGKVLVTGASGFVGGYVVRELVARGYEPVCLVRHLDRLGHSLPQEQRSRLRGVVGDVLNHDALAKAAHDCAACIHLIGIIEEKPLHGQTFQRMHVDATRAVLAACAEAGIRRYVHMSALGTRPHAVSRYHQTKWEAEELVRASRLDWTIFRPSLIHGPDGEFMRMMKFFSTSKIRQPVMPYFGSGNALIQPVSVRDVAMLFVRSLTMPETVAQVYELGGPERLTWKELYDACAIAITGRRRIKVPVPVPIARLVATFVMPLTPRLLVPYKFNVGQVQMSQEDSICNIGPIEKAFGTQLRDFRTELSQYADML